MAEREFEVVLVEAEWVLDEEPMGSKDKFWLERPGDAMPWLFKYSRVNDAMTTGEHWSEKLAAELAELIRVPHAQVELARFQDRWGSLSRKFTALEDEHVELVHGNELLAGMFPDYDPDQRFGQHRHTLDNVLGAVQEAVGGDKRALQEAYLGVGGFVVLDALILNTDRHHENWAVFRRLSPRDSRVEHWLAPSFDHASSLGRELTPDTLRQWRKEGHRVRWYAERGRGAVFRKPEGRKGANPLQLAELARRRWPEYVEPWIERLRAVGLHPLLSTVERAPHECMSDEHRWFVRELLEYSYGRLTESR